LLLGVRQRDEVTGTASHPDDVRGGSSSVGHAEAFEGVFQVPAHCALGEMQPARDLPVGHAVGDEVEQLRLAGRQRRAASEAHREVEFGQGRPQQGEHQLVPVVEVRIVDPPQDDSVVDVAVRRQRNEYLVSNALQSVQFPDLARPEFARRIEVRCPANVGEIAGSLRIIA